MNTLTGYLGDWNVQAGGSIDVMLGAAQDSEVDVTLVRLVNGDDNGAGPGFLETELEADSNGAYAVGVQQTVFGNIVTVADSDDRLAPAGDFTLWALVWPTTPDREQVLLARQQPDGRGYALCINASGQLECQLGDGRTTQRLSTGVSLMPRQWILVAASVDVGKGSIALHHDPVDNTWGDHLAPLLPWQTAMTKNADFDGLFAHADSGFTLAAVWSEEGLPTRCFNGKVDRCGVHARVLSVADLRQLKSTGLAPSADLVAAWDPSVGLSAAGVGDRVHDIGPHRLHGTGINKPVRAMTGFNWDGRNDCYRMAPEQFGALYCHEDAVEDAGWEPTLKFKLPERLKSGVYALRIRLAALEDHLPFFVTPATASARLAVVLPTATYLAVGNERKPLEPELRQGTTGEIPIIGAIDRTLCAHVEYGLSTRDTFCDGAGVCFGSRLRPMPTFRPRYRDPRTGSPRHLAADLTLLWWLEAQGIEFDVLTDERLHGEGAALLGAYDVVLSGTQPEVASPEMLDAVEDYLDQGGRYVYLGGHGFYWVCGFAGERHHLVEVRQLDTGSRDWQSGAGEYYLATSGERGGLWRHRGRAPQKLLGVGFTSEGSDNASTYRRMPDAWHRMYQWLFAGVDDQLLGSNGLSLDGAAGGDIDRYDWTLGTPQHARIMASSAGHSDRYPVAHEDLVFNFPGQFGTWDDRIRADMVLFTTRNEGAVFSVGSSSFAQSLPIDADASRLTRNVLDAFLRRGPLPGRAWSNEEKHWR